MKNVMFYGFLVSFLSILSLDVDNNLSSIRRAVYVEQVGKPVGPFSQGVVIEHAQKTLYLSGQLPNDIMTGFLEIDPARATEKCMQKLSAILEAEGMSFNDVVQTRIYLTNMADFPVINKMYESFLDKTQPYPARTTIQIAALPLGSCVEIDMIASK